MIKKTLTLLIIMFISSPSMGWSMEQEREEENFVIDGIEFIITPSIQSTLLPNHESQLISLENSSQNSKYQEMVFEELSFPIFNEANEGGLDLKTYRNQIFVCEDWRHRAIKSITTLDIVKLLETTPHRKCTLMAHIIADSPLHRFPNLRSLNISFQGFGIFEFHKKMTRPEKRNFNKQMTYFSDDQRLESYEKDLVETKKKVFDVIKDPNGSVLVKICKMLGSVPSIAWNISGYNRLTGASFNRDKNKIKMDSIYTTLEKSLITSFIDFQTLTTLKINAIIDLNLYFIAQMPNLKHFEVNPHSTSLDAVAYQEPTVFLDSLGGFYKSHDLEVLHINAPIIQLANFEGWSKLHRLRELSLPFEFSEKIGNEVKPITIGYFPPRNLDKEEEGIDKIHGILDSLVKNIPGLTSLQIKYGLSVIFDPRIKISKYISQLPKLEKLDASYVIVNDDDLEQFLNIKTLKKLVLREIFEADRNKLNELFVLLFSQLNLELKLYTLQGLDLFKLARPDVQIELRSGTSKIEIGLI